MFGDIDILISGIYSDVCGYSLRDLWKESFLRNLAFMVELKELDFKKSFW